MTGTTSTTAFTAIRVSVVVPTCGRMDLLDRCLDALTRQNLPASAYEVIVVDDEPSHHTLHLVAGWRTRTLQRGPRLVYLANTGSHGAAAARNLGWRAAQADVIAFTSDDSVPSAAWLAEGLAAFGDGVDALCGGVTTLCPPAPQAGAAGTPATEAEALCLANCFCRKRMLERLDGFDERFCEACHDDVDLHFRLLGAGARIAQAPQAEVLQALAPQSWAASLAQARRAVFDALLYKKHPRLYRERIGLHLPYEHYCAAGALLAALLALLAGQGTALALAALAWLALTVRLALRRLHADGSKLTKRAAHVAGIFLTSALLPPLAVFWRVTGAIRYRVRFT